MIVCGVGLFLDKDTPTNNNNNNNKLFNILGIGELLVFISLSLDGVTGVLQERLKASHNVSALQLMFGVNCIAPVYLITGLLVTGEGFSALYFIGRHPEVTLNLIAFSLASAIGQLFIFTTITTYGPLTCAVFTTTRKFFTILMSVLLFGNTLLQRQWVAVALVFIGLSIDAYIGSKKKTEQTKQQQQTQIA
ncbi:PREDICTED: solute carrier family 35 member B1-like [Amphimedon queenslandica]|uniref:Sugar phosphate transporter domain-containing protein n=1 Tax=Amphimedon queenslandica TaxID=400682 RepID=A0A1X7SSN5_AMPQE|nr:PREDICTED: solute carrier family 35 member B1-like [Amphimedon queenslandica]|eukprot:XP_003391679.3 PREDICTED: solute carrier family 35 member B1-like [Amphimedon queenslandica]